MLSAIATVAIWTLLGIAVAVGLGFVAAALALGAFFLAWLREIHLEAGDLPVWPPVTDPALVAYEYRRGQTDANATYGCHVSSAVYWHFSEER